MVSYKISKIKMENNWDKNLKPNSFHGFPDKHDLPQDCN